MTLFIGVDWGKKKSAFAWGEPGRPGQRPKKKVVPTRFSPLTAFFGSLPEAESQVAVIESGCEFLARLLHHQGITTYVVDAQQANHFRESLRSSGAKTDPVDAADLWHMAQSPAHLHVPYEEVDEDGQALRALLRALDTAIGERTRASNRVRSLLQEQMPDLEQVLSKLSTGYVRALLRWVPTAWHASRVSREDFDAFVKGKRVGRKQRESLFAALSVCGGYPWSKNEQAAKAQARRLRCLLESLELHLGHEKELESELESLCASQPGAVAARKIPGIGARLSASFAVLFTASMQRQAEQSRHGRDFISLVAGTSPVTVHSGEGHRKVIRRRARDKRLNHALYLASLQALRHLGWARAKFDYGRRRDRRAGALLRELGRSLLRLVQALVRDGSSYDDARYVACLKARGVPWAQSL